MKKTTKIKKTEENQDIKYLAKAIYKSIIKSMKTKSRAQISENKKDTKNIVNDILDPNYVAQVDPDEISEGKEKILYKAKSMKDKEKGVKKLGKFVEKKCKKDESIPGLS